MSAAYLDPDKRDSKREELKAAGYHVVVEGRTAHDAAKDCWPLDTVLIPLGDEAEAVAHGYQLCATCYPKTVSRAASPAGMEDAADGPLA